MDGWWSNPKIPLNISLGWWTPIYFCVVVNEGQILALFWSKFNHILDLITSDLQCRDDGGGILAAQQGLKRKFKYGYLRRETHSPHYICNLNGLEI